LKPEFSGFAGFKLLGLNMRSRARLKREPKTSWLGWGELKREAKNVLAQVGRTEERSQKRPGSGAGRLLLVRLKVNSLSLRHTFSFSSQKQLASKDPFVRNVFDFLSSAFKYNTEGISFGKREVIHLHSHVVYSFCSLSLSFCSVLSI